MRTSVPLLTLLVLLALLAPAAQADGPKVSFQRVTLRVGDTTVRGQTSPIKSGATVASLAIYVDGRLSPAYGSGSSCLVNYATRGLVVRVNACGKGTAPFRIAVANASGTPHRVTLRFRLIT